MSRRGDDARHAIERADNDGQFGPLLAVTLFLGAMFDPGVRTSKLTVPELGAVVAEESLTEFVISQNEIAAQIAGCTLTVPAVSASPDVAYVLLDSDDPDRRSTITLVRRPQSSDVHAQLDHWRVLAVGRPVEPKDISVY